MLLVWWDGDLEPVTSVQNKLQEMDYNVVKLGTLKKSHEEWKMQLKRLVIEHTPIFILIWNRHTNIKAVRDVYSGRIKLFNWDDPWSVMNDELSNVDCIDDVYSCCLDTKEYYLSKGAKTWTYLTPFYNPIIHYPDFDARYRCDVSFVCTNLYTDLPINKVDRSELMLALSREKDIVFHVYGPDSISFLCPENYRGPILYTENRKIFTSSKVNISLHITKGRGYINERCVTILASGGLLLMDTNEGVDELLPDSFVTMRDTIPEIVAQIKELINTDTSCVTQNGLKSVQKLSVDNWVSTILQRA